METPEIKAALDRFLLQDQIDLKNIPIQVIVLAIRTISGDKLTSKQLKELREVRMKKPTKESFYIALDTVFNQDGTDAEKNIYSRFLGNKTAYRDLLMEWYKGSSSDNLKVKLYNLLLGKPELSEERKELWWLLVGILRNVSKHPVPIATIEDQPSNLLDLLPGDIEEFNTLKPIIFSLLRNKGFINDWIVQPENQAILSNVLNASQDMRESKSSIGTDFDNNEPKLTQELVLEVDPESKINYLDAEYLTDESLKEFLIKVLGFTKISDQPSQDRKKDPRKKLRRILFTDKKSCTQVSLNQLQLSQYVANNGILLLRNRNCIKHYVPNLRLEGHNTPGLAYVEAIQGLWNDFNNSEVNISELIASFDLGTIDLIPEAEAETITEDNFFSVECIEKEFVPFARIVLSGYQGGTRIADTLKQVLLRRLDSEEIPVLLLTLNNFFVDNSDNILFSEATLATLKLEKVEIQDQIVRVIREFWVRYNTDPKSFGQLISKLKEDQKQNQIPSQVTSFDKTQPAEITRMRPGLKWATKLELLSADPTRAECLLKIGLYPINPEYLDFPEKANPGDLLTQCQSYDLDLETFNISLVDLEANISHCYQIVLELQAEFNSNLEGINKNKYKIPKLDFFTGNQKTDIPKLMKLVDDPNKDILSLIYTWQDSKNYVAQKLGKELNLRFDYYSKQIKLKGWLKSVSVIKLTKFLFSLRCLAPMLHIRAEIRKNLRNNPIAQAPAEILEIPEASIVAQPAAAVKTAEDMVEEHTQEMRDNITAFYTQSENQASLTQLVKAIKNGFEEVGRDVQFILLNQMTELIDGKIAEVFNIQEFYDGSNQKPLEFKTTPLAQKIKETLRSLYLPKLNDINQRNLEQMKITDFKRLFEESGINFILDYSPNELTRLESNTSLIKGAMKKILSLGKFLLTRNTGLSKSESLCDDNREDRIYDNEFATSSYSDWLSSDYPMIGKLKINAGDRVLFSYGWNKVKNCHSILIRLIGDTSH